MWCSGRKCGSPGTSRTALTVAGPGMTFGPMREPRAVQGMLRALKPIDAAGLGCALGYGASPDCPQMEPSGRSVGVYAGMTVGVVVPARDEEHSIGSVVADLLALRDEDGVRVVDDIVVCDNGSTDATATRAREAGARTVRQDTRGYGLACLTALAALRPVDIVLFTDGDRSFEAVQGLRLLEAVAGGADLAIGSRVLGRQEPGALSFPQQAGNRVASLLIRLLWGVPVTDLGPYRAIRAEALRHLDMQDRAYGWTVEMQVKAIQHGLRVVEVPVDALRRRTGRSKVGGTLRGVVGAGVGILSMIAGLRWRQVRSGQSTRSPNPRDKGSRGQARPSGADAAKDFCRRFFQ